MFEKLILKPFWQNKIILFLVIASAVANLGLWYFLYISIAPQSEDIVLHYNTIFGIDLLGVWYDIFILPLSGLLILLVNFVLAFLLFKQEKILSFFLLFAALAIQGFLILNGFFLVMINLQ